MNRKTIIIISAVIILILLGVGAYFFYFKKSPTGVPTPTGSAFPGEGQPVSGGTGAGSIGTGSGSEAFVPGGTAPLPRLYELHKLPVAGVGLVETGKGVSLTLAARYIERGLGHIFETPLSTYVESRIVNETRSRITEALWGNNGKSVVIRYLDDANEGIIKTRIINLGAGKVSFNKSTSTESVADNFLKTEEVFLPDYIPFVSTANDNADKLFYLENSNLSSVGSVSSFKNTGITKVFNSAFTEWLPSFPNQKLVTLTTKPSATIPGHLFFLDTKTKALTKVLGGINGLTTLTSPNGKLVLYAEIKKGVPELFVYDIIKKETRNLAIQTLPEKCVWGKKDSLSVYCAVPQTLPTATYPDQWYQGLLSFSDSLWKTDTKLATSEKILTPSDFGVPFIDITSLTLSSNDAYLLFINKVTSTPWVYRITEEAPLVSL